MTDNNKPYSFAFIGANALVSETISVAEVFIEKGDWEETYDIVKKKNLLHKIKEGTVVREFREIKKRLSTLNPDQLKLVIAGDGNQAKAMILLGIVRTYSFIRDFIIEVLRNKHTRHERMLLDSDYEKFVESKSMIDESIEELSDKSRQKIKTVILRILTQVGLLDDPQKKTILHPMLDTKSIAVITNDDPSLLKYYLYSDQEIRTLSQQKRI